MRPFLILLLAFGSVVAAGTTAAQEPQRLALLIGNQAYSDKVGVLKNPHNDIARVGTALEAVGFKVTSWKDAGRRQVLSVVKTFAAQLAKAGPNAVGFLYYSGHGVSRPDDKANYLIPVDLKDTDSADFWFDAVKLDDILGELERAAPFAAHFIVFDACRNELKLPDKTAVKGFEPVAERSGMFIAFATALGAVASDRGDASGPYASSLAAELVKPGQDHLQLFQNVKEGVFSTTGRRQVPWERNGLLRRVYFGGEPTAAKPAPAATPSPQLSGSEAAQAWAAAKDTTDPAVLEAFIKHYGDTFYGAMARSRLAELKKQQVAIAAPPKAPPPVKPVEPTIAIAPAPPAVKCDGVEALVGNERRCLKPKDTFKDCTECPEMVVLPSGEFMMGSEVVSYLKPVHKVTIAKPFAAGKLEVTFAEWDACVSAGGCKHKPDDQAWGRDTRPVINVSWDDVTKEYLPWLSRKTGKQYRLLTEAEWEYAARAGSRAEYTWGDEIGKNRANCHGCGSQWDSKQTAPVGSFQANAFGLHDMHGNVMEWVADCYKENYANAPSDAKATSDVAGCSRVHRGGSWVEDPPYLRSDSRYSGWPDYRSSANGFRLARTLSP